MSLTASDGTGLRLVSLSMRAALEDPLALTELHLLFENPNDTVIEGNFKIMLPPGASLSRFAMKTDAGWQEGEMVEKQAARRAYEDFLHKKQDPALLEQASGNEFAARVFPIPARGVKELILTYSQVLEAGASYTFPLEGLPMLDQLSLQVFAGDQKPVFATARSRFVPGADLTVHPERFAKSGGLRAGEYVMTRFVPFVDDKPDALGSCIVLFDTSASRALGLHEQTELLRQLIDTLPSGSHVRVLAFDQTTEAIFDGDQSAFGAAEMARIYERGALGASNLGAALDAVATQAGDTTRLIVLGDGVATAGETDAKKLRGHVENLRRTSLSRVDAIVIGGLRDQPTLEAVVRGGLARDGVVLDAKSGFAELRRKLDRATHSRVPVRVDGSTWSYPQRLDGVQAGDEVRVYAQVPVGVVPRIAVGDKPAETPSLHAASAPLLERAWASAKIQSLLEVPPAGDPERGRREVVALSRSHRVMSPYTAMLVLETEADYKRFDIDRHAGLDVLTVDAGHVAVRKEPREQASPEEGRDTPSAPWGGEERQSALREAAEFGMIGLLDMESAPVANGNMWADDLGQAFGAGGFNLLGGGHATSSPRMSLASPIVHGRIPPEVVARIVRQNLGRVRTCYDAALATNPDARGVVSTRIVIDRTGAVVFSGDAGSTFPDRAAVSCVARGMLALSFPQPDNGIVTVHLDFLLGDVTPPHADAAWYRNLSRPSPPPAPDRSSVEPYTGRFQTIMEQLGHAKKSPALEQAKLWQHEAPGDVMALVALGEAEEAAGNHVQSARAYGSILELFSFRADSRRFAGERLERIGSADAFDLAADAFRGAVEQRPDHPAGHRLLAYSLLRDGRTADAFAAIEAGVKQVYPSGRFAGVDQILREDAALLGLAWIKSEPQRKVEIEERMKALRVEPNREREPSVRFVLVWETDANDVDFHIEDGRGGHAYFGSPTLASGGSLYADVTTGYGPECFTVRGAAVERAYPYKLSAHYFSRGPMGYGMGKLQIVEHDGVGGLTFEERPFVIMTDHATVDLGVVRRPL